MNLVAFVASALALVLAVMTSFGLRHMMPRVNVKEPHVDLACALVPPPQTIKWPAKPGKYRASVDIVGGELNIVRDGKAQSWAIELNDAEGATVYLMCAEPR